MITSVANILIALFALCFLMIWLGGFMFRSPNPLLLAWKGTLLFIALLTIFIAASLFYSSFS